MELGNKKIEKDGQMMLQIGETNDDTNLMMLVC